MNRPNNKRSNNRSRRNSNRNNSSNRSGNRPSGSGGGRNFSSRKRNYRRGRNHRRNNYPQTPEDKLAIKYLTLLERHIQCRKKYFERFELTDPQHQAKLEREFSNSAKELLDFEKTLSPGDLELFNKKYNGLKLDTTYSSNRDIPTEAPEVDQSLTEEPHLLQSQIDAKFSDDTEESEGSLEDYKAYKGV